jgi:Flp pilus assembly protein TadD
VLNAPGMAYKKKGKRAEAEADFAKARQLGFSPP